MVVLAFGRWFSEPCFSGVWPGKIRTSVDSSSPQLELLESSPLSILLDHDTSLDGDKLATYVKSSYWPLSSDRSFSGV